MWFAAWDEMGGGVLLSGAWRADLGFDMRWEMSWGEERECGGSRREGYGMGQRQDQGMGHGHGHGHGERRFALGEA
jgi:hypothetical protein